MNLSKQRNLLLFLWFSMFFIAILIILYLYLDNWIEKDNFLYAIKKLNSIYAPFLGIMALFFWSNEDKKKKYSSIKINSKTPFYLAIFVSVIWNALILVFLLPLVFQKLTIEDSIENIENISNILSWMIAGAMGYYFGNINNS